MDGHPRCIPQYRDNLRLNQDILMRQTDHFDRFLCGALDEEGIPSQSPMARSSRAGELTIARSECPLSNQSTHRGSILTYTYLASSAVVKRSRPVAHTYIQPQEIRASLHRRLTMSKKTQQKASSSTLEV